MLLHFKDDRNWRWHSESFADHAQGLIDRRHVRGGELNVNRGAGDLYDLSAIFWHKTSEKTAVSSSLNGKFHCAAAPLTISIISFVIFACRTRFIARVRESIMSLALLVADSMAVMRAACSAAIDSSMA